MSNVIKLTWQRRLRHVIAKRAAELKQTRRRKMGKMKELDILTSRDEDDIITDDEQGECTTCEFVAEMIEANAIDRKDIEDWYCKDCDDKRKRAISTAAPRGWRVAG